MIKAAFLSAMALSITLISTVVAQTTLKAADDVKLVPIAPAWAGNTINVAIFRRNAVVSDGQTQYASFYDQAGHVVLAKRALNSSTWDIHPTSLTGNLRDAHDAICIALDGDGFLHIVWGHHNIPMRYARSKAAGSLELTDPLPMTGQHENRVTYPEFYNMPDGGLVCMYRDGQSGSGNLVMNRYDQKNQKWEQLHANLIAGQGQRSAYWQGAVDEKGTIHLSWVWRDSLDVASNHDMCYAKSIDGGKTWLKSDGQPYELPITLDSAEYTARIPKAHELINQTSMTTDSKGRPYIATYWRDEGTDVPQYHVIYHDGQAWRTSSIGQQTVSFRLGGAGTKRLPLSRPLMLAEADRAFLLFRDDGRGDKISVAVCDDLSKGQWQIKDLTAGSVDMWEPTYDPNIWRGDRAIHLFVQKATQRDGEGVADIPAEMAYILEWKP
ncbi:MAG TPA: BNR repeat-containing protein [Tepidisphaeraceae bacterium]|nr:BNR repeat-containing protein [Tepidisphaeraceae bacterium]